MLLTTLPENSIYTDQYGGESYADDARFAYVDDSKFERCYVTNSWELVTPSNPILRITSWCGNFMLISYDATVGNAKRLAERWNNDPDTHPNQIITHLLADGKQYPISDRQFTLF
jgi:hypothetical protein